MMDIRRYLLRIDGTAGLVVGVVVLLTSSWLFRLEGLPHGLLIVSGIANLVYGSYSTTLSLRSHRPMKFILFLVVANLTWAFVCIAFTVVFRDTITPLGVVHLVGEGIFVAVLAFFEWRSRAILVAR